MKNITRTIEYIDNNNELHSFLFLVPPICFFLSNQTKIQFLVDVDTSNASTKLSSLYEAIPNLIIEIEENYKKFQSSSIFRYVMKYNLNIFKLEIINNFINMIVYSLILKNFSYSDGKFVKKGEKFIHFLASINVFIAVFFLYCLLHLRFTIFYRILKSKNEKEKNISSQFLLKIKGFFYHVEIRPFIFHIICSYLGIFYSEMFFALQLFGLIFISNPMYSGFKKKFILINT